MFHELVYQVAKIQSWAVLYSYINLFQRKSHKYKWSTSICIRWSLESHSSDLGQIETPHPNAFHLQPPLPSYDTSPCLQFLVGASELHETQKFIRIIGTPCASPNIWMVFDSPGHYSPVSTSSGTVSIKPRQLLSHVRSVFFRQDLCDRLKAWDLLFGRCCLCYMFYRPASYHRLGSQALSRLEPLHHKLHRKLH